MKTRTGLRQLKTVILLKAAILLVLSVVFFVTGDSRLGVMFFILAAVSWLMRNKHPHFKTL